MRQKSVQMSPLESGEPSGLESSASTRSKSSASIDTVPDEEKEQTWPGRLKPDETLARGNGASLTRSHTFTAFGGRLRLRDKDDDDPTDWWFASTAIPLIAATFAPMANMLSIYALIVSWRNWALDIGDPDPAFRYSRPNTQPQQYPDPHWCYDLNVASLVCGFVGNVFLLCNFTRKIRYIIALPATIFLFYLASGILIGITVGMNIYKPPNADQVYSQGYWLAIIAAVLYLLNGMLLMANMLGYFLGHYPQHFDLNDEQRNLILQTMIFFIWLGGGGAIFARLEGWTYPDGLYFGVVTLLTIGFGDFYATNDVGRGLVFLYSVGGTIILGLMVSSIHKFAQELSKDKIVRKHVETSRVNTLSRVVTADPVPKTEPKLDLNTLTSPISRPLQAEQIQHDLDEKAKTEKAKDRTIGFRDPKKEEGNDETSEPAPNQFRFKKSPTSRISLRSFTTQPLQRVATMRILPTRSQKAIIMTGEKDRFDKMRDIQHNAATFKKWYALTMSVMAFAILLCVGALVFVFAEKTTQGLNYFQAFYFCYVCLLTIGYGDLSPRSNSGKAFFVVWALIAVPTMTILISDLGDTVIGGFKRGVLKYGGLAFLGKGKGWGLDWFVQKKKAFGRRLSSVGVTIEKGSKLESGRGGRRLSFSVRRVSSANKEEDELKRDTKTIEELANEELSETEMLKRLASAIRKVAEDVKNETLKRYAYEEWVEFTRLIRFTRVDELAKGRNRMQQIEYDEAVEGIIEWDWLDENSPMISEQPEPAWVLDRLLESLARIFRKKDILHSIALADAAVTSPEQKPSNPQTALAITKRIPPFSGEPQMVSKADDELWMKPVRLGRRRTSIHHPTPDGINIVEHHDEDDDEAPVWSKRGKARLHQHHLTHHPHFRHHKPESPSVTFLHHRPSHERGPGHGRSVGKSHDPATPKAETSTTGAKTSDKAAAVDAPRLTWAAMGEANLR